MGKIEPRGRGLRSTSIIFCLAILFLVSRSLLLFFAAFSTHRHFKKDAIDILTNERGEPVLLVDCRFKSAKIHASHLVRLVERRGTVLRFDVSIQLSNRAESHDLPRNCADQSLPGYDTQTRYSNVIVLYTHSEECDEGSKALVMLVRYAIDVGCNIDLLLPPLSSLAERVFFFIPRTFSILSFSTGRQTN